MHSELFREYLALHYGVSASNEHFSSSAPEAGLCIVEGKGLWLEYVLESPPPTHLGLLLWVSEAAM